MMSDLHPTVIEELRRHGLALEPGETPAALRGRLNELYLAAIRRLKDRLKAAEFPMAEYPMRVQRLKESFPLLGVPPDRWRR